MVGLQTRLINMRFALLTDIYLGTSRSTGALLRKSRMKRYRLSNRVWRQTKTRQSRFLSASQRPNTSPTSYLLYFAFAELQEALKNYPEVHTALKSLISTLHDQVDALSSSITFEAETSTSSDPTDREDYSKKVWERRGKELEVMKSELGVVWIMYMRFARRAEGLKPARTVFGNARKDKWCSWGVYEAAGNLILRSAYI
jgi:hypothetical protein